MKYGIAEAIATLKPKATWTLNGNDYSGLTWLDKTQTKPSEDELNTKLSELKTAEPLRLLRIERNKRLAECDWMANSDVTMSSAWKTYRQSLRDLPSSTTPKLDLLDNLDSTSVTWPTKPS